MQPLILGENTLYYYRLIIYFGWMKKVLDYLPITTIIFCYLFICGGLYLIGYWSKFGIDPFTLVEIWDIPKSFIMPFFISFGGALFLALINVLSPSNYNDIEERRKEVRPIEAFMDVLFVINWFVVLCVGVIVFFYFRDKDDIGYWKVSGITVSFLLTIKMSRNYFLRKYIPYSVVRFFIVGLFIFPPIFSFVIGTVNSLNVYQNKDIKIINPVIIRAKTQIASITDTTRLKLLGFLGDKFIISTLDNKRKFVLSQSAFDVIEIDEGNDKKK